MKKKLQTPTPINSIGTSSASKLHPPSSKALRRTGKSSNIQAPNSYLNHSRRTQIKINRLRQKDFVRVIGPVFEHSSWIAEATWEKRPFAGLTALHHALCETVHRSPEDKQLALIRAHPDLVGKAALAGTLTPSSTAEQSSAGLNKLRGEEVAAFQSYNNAYREKFGFPFVICARLNKKEAILKAFPVRLQNSREQEIKTALKEIYKIAYFRLEAIVGPE